MSYANKREELEMESSDRGLYKTDPEMIHKINNHEFPAFWPLIPLSNFTKDAYKTDQIHTTHQNGDEPLELHSSYELSIKGKNSNKVLSETPSPLKKTTFFFFNDRSFSPIELYWEKISLIASYKERKKKCALWSGVRKSKFILNEVSGIARPGTFSAILGPSGSGKTTLLNFLSNRMMSTNLSYSGTMMVNGVEVDSVEKIGNQVAYVMQDDILLATFTPLEAFRFCAELRMNASKEEKEAKIDALVKMLGIENCCNTIIGNNLIRGISGGERKRTSIGVELLTNPSLIFLDEPTTGLDSETALNIIKILKTLAKNGRTVISTIHQPSSSIFMEFDKLILLVEGNIIYQGDAEKSLQYFEQMGFPSPPFCNPSTFFMKCMNPEGLLVQNIETTRNYGFKLTEETYQEFKKRMAHMIDFYNSSEDSKNIKPTLQGHLDFDSKMNTVSWFKQFYRVLERGFYNQIRDPMNIQMQIFQALFFSILIIIIFYGLGSYKNEIQNREGCIFSYVMNIGFSSFMANLLTFAIEKPLFIREKMNRTYTLSAYFWGRTTSEVPLHAFCVTLFVTIFYFAVGLNDTSVSKFFILLLISNVGYFTGVSYGFFSSVIFPNAEMAMSLIPILMIPFLLFAGFFVNQINIPYYFYPFEYLSVFKYVFQAAFINEFTDKTWYSAPGEQTDPIGEKNFGEGLWTSIWIMAIIGFGLRWLGCIFLIKLSSPIKPKFIKNLPKNENGLTNGKLKN